MRVLVVTESFLPTVNGVTTSVLKVLEHLRERGHEAHVMVPACGAPDRYAGFPVSQIPAIPYRQFPVGLPGLHVQRIIEAFRPDVVHVASPFLLGAEAIAACRRLGIPTVAIFQTDVAGYARRNGLAAIEPLAWKIVRRIHRDATLTLVPSSSTMRDLRSAGLKHLKRWGRGVDLDRYHPRNRDRIGTRDLRDRVAPDGEVVIGYVGRIAPEKQLERLGVLRGMAGIRIVIVGDGPAMPAVRRKLEGMPVSFLGALHGSELAEAYAAFDIFVTPGEQETFGQTIQEAHATALPVVAPRIGGPVDLVAEGVDGFLYAAGDGKELRRCIGLLVREPELRQRMGEAGRRGVLGRSWETVCDRLVGHYAKVVAREALLAERRVTVREVERSAMRARKVS